MVQLLGEEGGSTEEDSAPVEGIDRDRNGCPYHLSYYDEHLLSPFASYIPIG